MSLADMTITPVTAPAAGGKPAGSTSGSIGRAPAQAPGTLVFNGGRFSSADGSDPAAIIKREGGSAAPMPSKEILAKFGATWAQDPTAPTAETGAKPVEVPAGEPAAAAPPAGATTEAGTDAAKPAEQALAAAPVTDDIKALFGERKPAEIKAELDRYVEANRRLVAEAETARAKPAAPVADDGDYIDDSVGFVRRGIARQLGITDPMHADVTAELQALTLDLNSEMLGAPLETAHKAARDAAKARQALARDKRTRTAQGDSSTASEEATTKQTTAFIGNRLSASRTSPDGKALPSLREQFPLAAAMAGRHGSPPLEAQIYEVYRRELHTGRFDPQRLNDDDYLIATAGEVLESYHRSQYQDLADALGKARPPSTETPPTTPAPAPAAATIASQGPPQGHGGRTALTAADSSVAPATPPTVPAPKPTTKKLQSREEFFARHYPKS
jgi:hypothetical protein